MNVLLASPRGFCAGVEMAIECLDETIRCVGPNIFVYHEIVHNRIVVERFQNQGVTFVDSVDEVPCGSTLVFSAHGVSPAVRQAARERKLQVIDATCPLVTKVHLEAIRYAREGYTIILIGHRGHDEIIGTIGEAPDNIVLVESPEDVELLQLEDRHKLACLTQTTLSVDEANTIMEKLRRRYPHLESPPKEDICYATTNRQDAIKPLLESADLLIVVGSQNSSNSRRLLEKGLAEGVPGYLVDGAGDLQLEWFADVEMVVMTAGASAPESAVTECVDYLKHHFNAEFSEVVLRDESMRFPLPRELQILRGLDSGHNRVSE
jgi:4-hydroxy-3-methylbut-2-en-1-yl diphosphate reductase